MADAIRIRIAARDERGDREDSRSGFWGFYRRGDNSNESISQLEAKLCRGMSEQLAEKLVEVFSKAVRESESALDLEVFHDVERFFFRFGGSDERNFRSYQFAEAYTKYLDYRLEILKSNPSLMEARSRVTQAASVYFSVRIAQYSSLNLDVFVAPIERVAKLFDNDFDSFRVFLDAFVPVMFAETLSQDFADQNSFSVSAPQSFQTEFNKLRSVSVTATNQSADLGTSVVPASHTTSNERERAVWLWRLANGSLLIPVLIALFVCYFGLKELADLRETESRMLAPVLQYQLDILKEDRLRIPGQQQESVKDAGTAANSKR